MKKWKRSELSNPFKTFCMEYTIYKVLSEDWKITKKTLKELGINPDKNWEDATVADLSLIASKMDIRIADLF